MNFLEKLFEAVKLPPKTLAKILVGSVVFLLLSPSLLTWFGVGTISDRWYQVALVLTLLSAALLVVEGCDSCLARYRSRREREVSERQTLDRLLSLTPFQKRLLLHALAKNERVVLSGRDDSTLLSLQNMGFVTMLAQAPLIGGSAVWEVTEDIRKRLKANPALLEEHPPDATDAKGVVSR